MQLPRLQSQPLVVSDGRGAGGGVKQPLQTGRTCVMRTWARPQRWQLQAPGRIFQVRMGAAPPSALRGMQGWGAAQSIACIVPESRLALQRQPGCELAEQERVAAGAAGLAIVRMRQERPRRQHNHARTASTTGVRCEWTCWHCTMERLQQR